MAEGADESGVARAVELLLQVVGAAAALAAWTALVGGAQVALKFDHAGVPSPLRAASMLPRQELVAIGASALAAWIVIGIALAGAAYLRAERADAVVRFRQGSSEPHDEASVDPLRLAAVALPLVFVLLVAVLVGSVVTAAVAIMLLVPALAGSAFLRRRTAGMAAAGIFVATLAVGGAAQTLGELAKDEAQLDGVVVDRRVARSTVRGYFVARDNGDIHVAVLPKESRAKDLALVTVPRDEVESIVIGPPVRISEGKPLDEKTVTDVPSGTTVSQGGTTVNVNTPKPPSASVPEQPPGIVLSHEEERVGRDGLFIIALGPQHEAVDVTVKVWGYRPAKPHLLIKPKDRHIPAGGHLNVHVRAPDWLIERLRKRGRATVRFAIAARSAEGSSSVRARLVLRPGKPS
jgi:hypothetical protein